MIVLWLYIAFSYLYLIGTVCCQWKELDYEERTGAVISVLFSPFILPIILGIINKPTKK